MLQPDEMIGKYRIVRALGKGGMGTVYLGWDDTLKREVAIKVMNPKVQGVENALRRFCAEAQAIARLSHAHLVHVYDFDPQASMPYIVMEYVRGESLAEIIKTRAPVPVDLVLHCARQALLGLDAAHRAGIIHRDIKPANILLSTEDTIKIMDFGLARSLDVESGLTVEGMVVGTIHYLAPEVARGDPATVQSDLYSLGVTLYEMLAGTVPFDDESPLKVISRIVRETPQPILAFRNDIPPALAAWLHKILEKNPQQRYSDAKAALAGLAMVQSGSLATDDPLHDSDVASTAEIPATPQPSLPAEPHAAATADNDASHDSPPPAVMKTSDLDVIMARALEIEKQGRDALSEESLLDIAGEMGLSLDAVRQAMGQHQANQVRRLRTRRVLRLALPAAAALLLVAVVAWVVLRPPTRERRMIQATGGRTSEIPATAGSDIRAERLMLDENWTDTGLRFDTEEDVLLVQVLQGGPAQCRVEGTSGVEVTTTFYGRLQGTGAVQARAGPHGATIVAACARRLRLGAMSFTAGKQHAEETNVAQGTGEVVATRLAQSQCFTVVERSQIEDTNIKNLKLENSEYFDPKTTHGIGALLGVDYLLVGAVQKAGQRYRFTAKRVETETGKVLENVVVDGTDPFALQDQLAAALRQRIIQTELNRLLPLESER